MSEERAREYVRLSNAHDAGGIGEMLAEEAGYRSVRAGEYSGRDAILSMMRAFFSQYPDVAWTVESFSAEGPGRVTFFYEIRGTAAGTGVLLAGGGMESLEFDPEGRILHVEVG